MCLIRLPKVYYSESEKGRKNYSESLILHEDEILKIDKNVDGKYRIYCKNEEIYFCHAEPYYFTNAGHTIFIHSGRVANTKANVG